MKFLKKPFSNFTKFFYILLGWEFIITSGFKFSSFVTLSVQDQPEKLFLFKSNVLPNSTRPVPTYPNEDAGDRNEYGNVYVL